MALFETNFFRESSRYTLFEHKRNGEILEPVDEKIRRYESNWLRNITRMNSKCDARHNVEL